MDTFRVTTITSPEGVCMRFEIDDSTETIDMYQWETDAWRIYGHPTMAKYEETLDKMRQTSDWTIIEEEHTPL